MKRISRRRFMKETVVLGAGMVAVTAIVSNESPFNQKKDLSSDETASNPNVDNLRVVGIGDPSMTIDQILRIYMGGSA